jgi:hypothetical protein
MLCYLHSSVKGEEKKQKKKKEKEIAHVMEWETARLIFAQPTWGKCALVSRGYTAED